jgi:hypothetical protein
MMCMRVDLPEPDGPITATNSPVSIRSDTPRSAATSSGPLRYSFTIWCSSITGVPATVAASGALNCPAPRCRCRSR